MNNIRVKQESLNDWRTELQESTNCECEGCDCNPCVECGEDCHNLSEEIEGGINVQNVADGLNFTEVETVDIIKPEPIKGASNWQLEMAVESLISEGYNDDEIVTILTEEPQNLMELDRELTAAGAVLSKYGPKIVQGAKTAIPKVANFAKGVFNRGIRDSKLTKDIIDVSKKLRKPDGISVTKPKIDVPEVSKGGGLVKSFKGFMDKIKTRTGAKLERIKGKDLAKKAEIQSTAKDVDVLGGAATNPATKVKPMKNITPSSFGDKITNATNKIKIGAGTAAVTGGVVAGNNLTGGSSSKVAPAAPITNDGKKEVDPSKNEKISTNRELRNQRNDALSSKEGKSARRDARLQKKKNSGFPSKRMKSGTPVNQLFNKEEVTNEGLLRKVAKIGIGAFALKKGGEFLKKKGDEALDGARKNMKIGGDKRKSDIEKATGVKLDHYSWRDELGLIEGNRTRYKGVGLSGSGNKKDMSKGPNEKVGLDYSKIRANAPVKTDIKVG